MDVLSAPAPATRRPTLSVVVPAYNEEAVLGEFHRRLATVLDGLPLDAEIIFVNDGSRDATSALLGALNRSDPRVIVIELSRNFGKEIALTAGLDCARGDAVIVIDADLQDPPELIAEMVPAWQAGHDVVLMRRASRDEGWFKKATAHAFYGVIGRLSSVPIPANVGDFRLLSRRAVDALKRLPERSRFMKGMFAWIGFPTREIDYRRDSRHAGKTKWNYWRLWNFALEGITSFSAVPLKIASYVGVMTALVAFAYGAVVIGKTLLFGEPVRGYPTLVVLVLFLGGLQLMALGIIGEYLARTYIEVKQRPLYIVQRTLPAARVLPPPAGAPQADASRENAWR